MTFQPHKSRTLLLSFLSGIFLLTLGGCRSKDQQGAPPAMVVQVVAFKALKQTVSEKISLVGTMEANEYIEIKSEIDGVVETINFKEGEEVKKGEVLLTIDRRKLEAQLALAEANLKLAESTAARYKALIENRAVSQQEYDQAIGKLEADRASLELTKAQLRDATLTAPFDGVLGARLVSEGQFISKGTTLSYLINQNPMKAEFRVPERYLSKVKTNQEIQVKVAAYPDELFSGNVYFIDPQIDELTRTALVKAYVKNPEGKLRRGMFAGLDLIVDVQNDAIVIPETALIFKGDDVSVFTLDENNIAHQQAVKTGVRFDGKVQILSGVEPGQGVVVEGHQKLHEGARTNPQFSVEEKKAP